MPAEEAIGSVWTLVDGRRMHARVTLGEPRTGLPVVFVHGLGVASAYFGPTMAALAREHRSYAPDLPGFGRSDKPAEVLGVGGLADALGGWLQALRLEGAALVGNSFGCQVVADLAAREPGVCSCVVLQGPTTDPAARTARAQVARWLAVARHERASQLPLVLRDYARAGIRTPARTFRLSLADPVEEKLPRVRVPALVVRGGRDTIVPQRWAEEAAALLPNGRLVVVPGGSHALVYAAPGRLARILRVFLADG